MEVIFMKTFYYERLNSYNRKPNTKRKALGTKHVYSNGNGNLVVYYNAERGSLTEESTGLLVAMKFNFKDNVKFLFEHFDEILSLKEKIMPQLIPLSELEEVPNDDLICV